MSNVENSSPKAFGGFPRSPSFQSSVHQIPTPGIENTRPPRYVPVVLKIWFVGGVALLMISLSIGLLAALHVSETRNGFAVPAKAVGFVSSYLQSLMHFTTVLLVIPFKYFWSAADQMLRWYQPYVTLSEGNAPASRSILLDYIALSQFSVVYHSWIHKHYLVNVSTLVAISVIFLQPLAGSLLSLYPMPYTSDATALVTSTIALSPVIDNLDVFFASTGFVLASVYDHLADPPFVHEDWTAGKFQPPPGSYLNGTLAVNTTAIQTNVSCSSPTSLNVADVYGSYVASATFPSGCSAQNVFSPSNGSQQFNVVNASSCASADLDIMFQPVVFWFYLNASTPQVASVYCDPTMNVFTVETSMDLNDGSLGPCTNPEPVGSANNVTGSPQNGRPFNGVVFDQSENFYVASRASAINFGVPDAIYSYAAQQPGGPLSVFQDEYGFLNATTAIYTQHLAVAAQANFFLASNSTIHARLTSQVQRIYIEAFPAYVLSSLMAIVGFVGLAIHYLHRRARRRLWLTSPPGSIAAIMSLTSRSGFGELLLPYNDERQMRDNLAGLTFRLDRRTGAIVAEEDVGAAECADGVALLGRKKSYSSPTFFVDGDPPFETPLKLKGDLDDTP